MVGWWFGVGGRQFSDVMYYDVCMYGVCLLVFRELHAYFRLGAEQPEFICSFLGILMVLCVTSSSDSRRFSVASPLTSTSATTP